MVRRPEPPELPSIRGHQADAAAGIRISNSGLSCLSAINKRQPTPWRNYAVLKRAILGVIDDVVHAMQHRLFPNSCVTRRPLPFGGPGARNLLSRRDKSRRCWDLKDADNLQVSRQSAGQGMCWDGWLSMFS